LIRIFASNNRENDTGVKYNAPLTSHLIARPNNLPQDVVEDRGDGLGLPGGIGWMGGVNNA